MRAKNVRALGAAVVLVFAGTTLAGGTGSGGPGTVTDGPSSYTYFGAGTNGRAVWVPGGLVSGSQLFESWWFYRASNQSREYSFAQGVPNTTNYTGNVATFTGDESDANVADGDEQAGLTWTMTWTVTSGDIAQLQSTLSVTNTTDEPITLNMFHYGDVDLNGNLSDSAFVNGNGDIIIQDTGSPGVSIAYAAQNASSFQIEVQDDLLELLNDDGITNLDNQNNVTDPADFSAGFQWVDVILQPGETEDFVIGFSIIPAPGAAALFGLAGLSGVRRRRS